MHFYQIIFFLPTATCLLCWYQILQAPITTTKCEMCVVSRIDLTRNEVPTTSIAKICSLNNTGCNTLCRDAARAIHYLDSSTTINSCKATCCATDLCNNDELLDSLPFYNDASQRTGMAFLKLKIFFGILCVTFAKNNLL